MAMTRIVRVPVACMMVMSRMVSVPNINCMIATNRMVSVPERHLLMDLKWVKSVLA